MKTKDELIKVIVDRLVRRLLAEPEHERETPEPEPPPKLNPLAGLRPGSQQWFRKLQTLPPRQESFIDGNDLRRALEKPCRLPRSPEECLRDW